VEALTEFQEKLERNSDMEVADIISELETFKGYLAEMLGEM
jgi:hypothetical protein